MALLPPYSTTISPLASLRSIDDPRVLPHRPADDVVIEQAVEGVALPLRPGNVAAEDQLRLARRRLVDAFVEGRAEIAQRPVILEVRRLVQQPGRGPARPAVAP